MRLVQENLRPTSGAPGALGIRRLEVNLSALRDRGLLAPEDEEPQMANQYRRIKRSLLNNAIGRGTVRVPNGQLIMVASALAGEGKTFTTINLALSLCKDKDRQVLLIDADVAKAHISRVLGAGEAPGLLDVLREEHLGLESVILRTDVSNLSVLAAGTRSLDMTELLESLRMEEVMGAIAQNDQRVALIDSPPLLLATESQALARVAGQVVMVVRARTTPQQSVLAALSYLGPHPMISLVLNQTTDSGPADYYYGYPGQYNHRGSDANSAAHSPDSVSTEQRR